MWSLYLLSGQGSAPPCSCHYLILEYLPKGVVGGQTSAAQPGAHLSPDSMGQITFEGSEYSILGIMQAKAGLIPD